MPSSGEPGHRLNSRDPTLAVRRTRVKLPDDVIAPFEVFVNGVPQQHGKDYEQIGRSLRRLWTTTD